MLLFASSLSTVLAQSPVAFANVVGADTQNFNATPDGLDFVTVESSEVLRSGVFNLGLFLNYAANTLPEFPQDGASADPKGKLQDRLLGADFNFAVGLFRNFQFGLSLPHTLSQSIVNATDNQRGQFAKPGTTEIRPSLKFRFFGDQHGGVALVSSAGVNMIEGNAWTGEGAPPILNFTIAADTELGRRVALGLNLGYRKRTPGEKILNAPVEPLGDQYIGSLAASTLISKIRTKAIAEIYTSTPVKKGSNFGDRTSNSAEGLLGLKHDATTDLAVHIGGAMGLGKGIASPDWRLYAGVNYTFGPLFKHKQKEDVRKRKPKKKPKPNRPSLEPKNQPEPYENPVIDEPSFEDDNDGVIVHDNPFIGTPTEGEETFVISNVMFAFDEDKVVLIGTKDILKNLKSYLYKTPVFKSLVIEGHTDYVGGTAYNQDLSERRAEAIKRYLIDILGVEASKVASVGYGESRPVADNGNFQGRQLNRRVEFKISR